ncbi:MAG: (Fe-S)-binding protein [Bacillota bacterium]|nr:(Fe-S)-binding protein [Bacillota bacterium]
MAIEDRQITDSSFDFDLLDRLLASVPDGAKLKTCIQCGSCSGSCPAAENVASTRRYLWRMLQMGMVEETISSKLFWDCTTCSMCEIRCPRGIPLGEIVFRLREEYNAQKGAISSIGQVTSVLDKAKNITGDAPGNRMLWTDNIPGISQFRRESLVKDRAKVVYFTGCVSSLFPQSYKIPQALTQILLKSGVDFSLLGEDEWCCGFPLLAGGSGGQAVKEYILHNLEAVRNKGADTLLISCPTCYHVWKHEYPKIMRSKLDIEIKHYVEFLPDIINLNKMEMNADEVVVTYHDPCDLGRKSGIVQPPRELIKALSGVQLVEMRFSREDSKCCGGGGNLEMINPDLAFEIAQKRITEALETGAQYLLTACQQCKRTLQNAARRTRVRIKVYDILEFLAERIKTESGGEKS